MFRTFSIAFLLLLANFSFGQDSLDVTWKMINKFPIDSAQIWHVDQLNNVFISNGSSMMKYDSTGTLKFQQSVKSLGKIKQVLAINSMKIVYFSDEQQTLCFFDNTLTAAEDCIDLADYEIYNAEFIAVSSRPDYVWVYDNVNSTLKLISLTNSTDQEQEIVNLKGMLGISEVSQIMEESGYLYILEKDKRIFVLDYYGGLVDSYSGKDVLQIDRDRSSLDVTIKLTSKHLELKSEYRDLQSDFEKIDLPIENSIEFQAVGKYVYLRTARNIYKYTLHFNN